MKRLALVVALAVLAACAGGETDSAGGVDTAALRRADSVRADSARRDSIQRRLIDTTGAAKTKTDTSSRSPTTD